MTHEITDDTRKIVETASGVGLPQELISHLLGITTRTLSKRYRKELDQGKAKACLNVAQTLYSKATRDRDTASIVWFEKTRTGLREPRDPLTLQTAPGNPLQFSAVTREELTADILRGIPQSPTGSPPQLTHEGVKDNSSQSKPNGKANGHL